MTYSVYIQSYSGWDQYGALIRQNADRVMQLLENPCAGQRLRHPPNAHGQPRWDWFCKWDMPRNFRILYTVLAGDHPVVVEMVGFHFGGGKLGDVYDRLAMAWQLPAAHGHTLEDPKACCDGPRADWAQVDPERAKRLLLRAARRRPG